MGLAALIDFLPTGSTPLSLSSTPDWTVLGFTTLISVLAGVVFGLVPALQSTRPRLADTLKDQAAAVLHGGSVKLRKTLVVPGADTGSVVWMVMREVLLLAAIGVVIGTGAAWAATRLIQAQLFGVRATDLATIAAAALGIVLVAALSGYLPARRATAIDPVTALRWE